MGIVNMIATSAWKMVAVGLTLKLVAMWMILPSTFIPTIFPTHFGLMYAALVPLSIDLVGRCFCAWAPVAARLPIRLSILAQSTGIVGLTAISIATGVGGVILGLIWAAVFQVSAAKQFIEHLSAIALTIGQPTIATGMKQLRQRLLATTMSVYGSGGLAMVVVCCVIFFGIMTWGIGFFIAIPLSILILTPPVVSCMALYFLMLYSYERSLRELRRAVYAMSETKI